MSDLLISAPPEAERVKGPGVLRQLMTKPTSAVAIVILTVLVCFALFAPWIAPFDPSQASAGPRLGAPEAAHIFGTDLHGRQSARAVSMHPRRGAGDEGAARRQHPQPVVQCRCARRQ